VDQIGELVKNLRKNPQSRRHLVSAWNVGDIPHMALPPCHSFFQFHVTEGGDLRCQLYQRSADLFLGIPFNIASYALLTHLVAQVCGFRPKEFIHSLGDYHIYLTHEEQVKEQLSRTPRPLPRLQIRNRNQEIDDFQFDDFQILDYDPYPNIPAPVAV
jgi:thymidylate synthase